LHWTEDVEEDLEDGVTEEAESFASTRRAEMEAGAGGDYDEVQLVRLRALCTGTGAPWATPLDLEHYVAAERAKEDGAAAAGGSGRPQRAAKRRAVEDIREAVAADERELAALKTESVSANASPASLHRKIEQTLRTLLNANLLGLNIVELTDVRKLAATLMDERPERIAELQSSCDVEGASAKEVLRRLRRASAEAARLLIDTTSVPARELMEAIFQPGGCALTSARLAGDAAAAAECALTGHRLYDMGMSNVHTLTAAPVGAPPVTLTVAGSVVPLIRAIHTTGTPVKGLRDLFAAWLGDEASGYPASFVALQRTLGVLTATPVDTTARAEALDHASVCAREFIEDGSAWEAHVDRVFEAINYIFRFLKSASQSRNVLIKYIGEHARATAAAAGAAAAAPAASAPPQALASGTVQQ
jgi:hypothetical protein